MRLTKKKLDSNNYCLIDTTPYIASNKLGQLEDIEEELGIDLITLLKVQTTGAYFKGKDKKWIPMTDYDEKCFKLSETKIYRFYFKDYGKTWALTREELL